MPQITHRQHQAFVEIVLHVASQVHNAQKQFSFHLCTTCVCSHRFPLRSPCSSSWTEPKTLPLVTWNKHFHLGAQQLQASSHVAPIWEAETLGLEVLGFCTGVWTKDNFTPHRNLALPSRYFNSIGEPALKKEFLQHLGIFLSCNRAIKCHPAGNHRSVLSQPFLLQRSGWCVHHSPFPTTSRFRSRCTLVIRNHDRARTCWRLKLFPDDLLKRVKITQCLFPSGSTGVQNSNLLE